MVLRIVGLVVKRAVLCFHNSAPFFEVSKMNKKKSTVNEDKQLLLANTPNSIINIEWWKSKLSGDTAAVYRMLELLLTELSIVKKQLAEACENHDRDSIKKIVEKLHNNLLFCGVPRLKTLLRNFYIRLPRASDESIAKFYARFLVETDKVTQLGRIFLKEHHQSH
jgi:HPt (histidine-containing phosphotransfer) domain-containing protein